MEALIGQQGAGVLGGGTGKVIHGFGLRLGAHAHGNPEVSPPLDLFPSSGLLGDDLALLVSIMVLLGHQADVEVTVSGGKVFIIPLPFQVGYLHIVPLPVQQNAVEQGHQEDHNGDHRHGAADHNGSGSHPAALLFLLPDLCLSALLGPADAVGFPGGYGRSRAHRGNRPGFPPFLALAEPCRVGSGTDAGFCLDLFLRRGLGAVLGFAGDSPGGVVHQEFMIEDNGGIFPELLHILEHFRGGNVPVPDVQRHGLHDDLLHSLGNVGVQGRRQRCAAVDVLNGHRHRRLSVVGGPTGHHLIHHHAQGVKVGAVVRVPALGLLGGNVVNGTQGLLGQGVALVHHPGDAKVHHLH